jgi:hypothetical protein
MAVAGVPTAFIEITEFCETSELEKDVLKPS